MSFFYRISIRLRIWAVNRALSTLAANRAVIREDLELLESQNIAARNNAELRYTITRQITELFDELRLLREEESYLLEEKEELTNELKAN